MDKCSKCGHYTMVYQPSEETWVCWCQNTWDTKTGKHPCSCTHRIPESYESFNRRLGMNNRLGRYYVEPPNKVI